MQESYGKMLRPLAAVLESRGCGLSDLRRDGALSDPGRLISPTTTSRNSSVLRAAYKAEKGPGDNGLLKLRMYADYPRLALWDLVPSDARTQDHSASYFVSTSKPRTRAEESTEYKAVFCRNDGARPACRRPREGGYKQRVTGRRTLE